MKYASRDKRPLSDIGLLDQKIIDNIKAVIPASTGNYTHPSTHPATMIVEDTTHMFVTSELKSNYDSAVIHAGSTHAPINAQKNSDITKEEIEAKLTGPISTHTHSGGSDPWTVVKLGADFVTSLATNTNVTNFLFTPQSNKTYLIFGYFLLRTATATVGARPGVAWPSGLIDGIARMEASNSLIASAIQLFGARTTKNAASTGLATTGDSHWGSLDGIMITAANVSGNFQITLASETAGTNVTMKAGSVLMYREL